MGYWNASIELKATIMVQNGPSWPQILPFVLLDLHTAACEEFAASQAVLVYEENPRLPGDLVLDKRVDLEENELLHLIWDGVDVFVGRT